MRERLRRQRTRLKGTLESFLRNRDTAKYLQDQVVTDRNGRFVLVVRAEHRSAIPGIVHGSSSSGASLYLEPLSTVEINNDIVALEQQEAEEVRRILLGLTDQYRRRALDLQRTIEAATELDVIQAKARLSAIVERRRAGARRATARSSCSPPGIRCSSRRSRSAWPTRDGPRAATAASRRAAQRRPGAGRRQAHPRHDGAGHHRARTRAARRWR